jgi:hypothetical protein
MQYQAKNNRVYSEWIGSMKLQLDRVRCLEEIPFIPIHFFKTHAIYTGDECPKFHFESSGTTQDIVSKHFVKDLKVYEQSFMECFEKFYGDPKDYCILSILPNYLERQHSSLVYMTDQLIKASKNSNSGFYLYNFEKLNHTLATLEKEQQKTLLIGVSFALMDFVDAYPQSLKHTKVMETGGMKGRRKELTRAEVHETLMNAFQVPTIHGEYGMTELLSQAYATGNGIYKCPPWMRVLVTEEEDPLTVKTSGRGTLQVIDLANIHSCSFIATEDVGAVYADGSFEVFGRMDHSALRGCSLMVI